MIQKCIVCGHQKFKTVLKINNAPAYVERLLNRGQIKHDRKISLTLISCRKCKLTQLKRTNFVERNFYDQYQMAVSYSKQMRDYQKWLAKDFVAYFNLKGKSAFEIGCGEGMFGSFLNQNGLKTLGVEPSKPFYHLAKKKIKVFNQYLDKKTSLKKNYYDAFVARQVFEHLKKPNQVLKDAKLYLKPSGVGLIEVPSFLTALKNNRYYDIFRDHTAYYTKYTLQYLLNQNNFTLRKIFHSAEGEYLTAYFKNNDDHSDQLKSFSHDYLDYKKAVQKLFAAHKKKKIAVWGAGGKGIALLALCDIRPEDILFVIDSDPHKQGKYTTRSHILIKAPGRVNFKELDLIIVSAVMYQKEIISNLKTRYHYKNKIGIIVPQPHIL